MQRVLLPSLRRKFPFSLHYHPHRSTITTTMSSSSSSSEAPISPSTTRVGWIGTGVMGLSMASHLLRAGCQLTVFNRTPSKALPLAALGATVAPSPTALASSADVVFLMLGYPSDVRHVALSSVVPSLPPGSLLVDMTTSDPSLASEIASATLSRGCVSLDAPVSGGDRGAREGTLAIFAGGDEAALRRVSPLLELMGKVHYMGRAGAGQRAKLGNQIAIASTMVGMVEGMVYAQKAGLDVGRWMGAIAGGAAGSRSLELYGRRVLERDLGPGFYVKHFVKDLGICLEECRRMGLALPGLALAQQLYVSLVAHGEGDLGTQALVLALERLNNTRIGGGVVQKEK